MTIESEGNSLLERVGRRSAAIGDAGPAVSGRGRALRTTLIVVIVASFGAFLATQIHKLPDYDWHFEPGWLLAAAAALSVLYLGQAEIWRRIIGELHGHLAARPAQAIFAKSLLARYIPTNVMMIVLRVVLSQRHGVPKRITFTSTIYEFALSLFAAAVVGAYFVITLPSLQGESARFVVLGVVPVVLVAMHPHIFHPLADWGLRKLGREPLPSTLSFAQVIGSTLLYAMTWAAAGLGVFCFAAAVHPVPDGQLGFIVAAYAIGYLVSALTFVMPSGIGTRDAALAACLSAVLPGAVSLALAVGFRLFQTLVELVYVAAVTLVERQAERTKRSTGAIRSPGS